MEATIGLGAPRHGRHDGRPRGRSTITVAELLERRSEFDVAGETRPTQPVPASPATTAPVRGVHSTPTETARRKTTAGKRRVLLASGSAVLAVAVAVPIAVAHSFHSAGSTAPRVDLTTSQVHIGRSYFAAASGFSPGEEVRFSWAGPTRGVMGTFAADPAGRANVRGPIMEKDPPGSYQIIATGLASGHTVAAPLQVLPPGDR